MSYEGNASKSQEQHIWIAERAVEELYGLAGWARVVLPPGYLIFSQHVARLIESLKKEQCTEAVLPVITYLLHVPLFDGSGSTKSNYAPPKPDVYIIETVVNFLAWMGDPQAIPALQRLTNTNRNIPLLLQDDHYADAPNDHERAHAAWAIKIIQAVQSKGYRLCQSCNGLGSYYCPTCKGAGTVKKRFFLWKRKMRCPDCYGAKTIECSNCEGFGKLLPTL